MYYLDINLTTRKQERPLNTVTAHITLISDTFQEEQKKNILQENKRSVRINFPTR